MPPASKRRAYLRRLGAAEAEDGAGGVPATAADGDAGLDRNTARDGEPAVEVSPGEAKIADESTCEPGAPTLTAEGEVRGELGPPAGGLALVDRRPRDDVKRDHRVVGESGRRDDR